MTTPLRQVVRTLGPEGAKAGITQSRLWTVDELKKAAEAFGLKFPEKATRQQIIDEIIRIANRRIEKSVDELYAMTFDDLMRYFDEIQVTPAELLDVLKELDLAPRKEGRRKLMEFAARELSETGRFMTISGRH